MPTHHKTNPALHAARSIILFIFVSWMVMMILPSCAWKHARSQQKTHSTPNRYTYARLLMGSRCKILLYAESERQAAAAATAAFDEIARIETILTDYNPESESMRVLRKQPNQWHAISSSLYDMLTESKALYELSSGAFDPTIGACTHLWRRTTKAGRIPSDDERAQALASSGFNKLILDPDSHRLMFTTSGMILDFGGIGKGYAADRALEVLTRQGITQAMIDLGGDLVLGDSPPDNPIGWRIDIQTGLTESTTQHISNNAIATSGDLEQHFVYQGQRYSHILDPQTALGITHPIAVTVIAPDATTADAIASMISVLGPDWSNTLPDLPATTLVTVVTPD